MTVTLDLDDRLDELAEALAEKLANLDSERVGPGEAARRLGYPRGHFSPSAHPERVPHFGQRGTLWPTWKWKRWNEVPEGARLRQWDAIPLRARSLIRGVA